MKVDPTRDGVMALLRAAANVTVANADKRARAIDPDRPIEVEDRSGDVELDDDAAAN